jgi:hypothetical protein
VAGRPGRAGTLDVLAWCSAQLAAPGVTAWRFSGDHASWPRRHAVRRWLRQQNPPVTRGAVGVRLVVDQLPRNRPWLHPIAPTWGHGQRAVSAADRRLRADALDARVYASDGGAREAPLVMPKKLA